MNGSATIKNAASPNLINRNVEHNLVCQDGTDTNTESTNATGYVSDYYFVDGEALAPETFGKSFEGKWGPLDSKVVLENIKGKTKSPYEERPNMDEKWSDYWDVDAINVPYTFDGTTYSADRHMPTLLLLSVKQLVALLLYSINITKSLRLFVDPNYK